MESAPRLDRVTVFNDKLSFLIPHEWVEKEEGDDLYLSQLPEADSGWFRVSLNTSRVTDEIPSQALEHFFEGKEGVTVETHTGNVVRAYEKDTKEDDWPIHIYYWFVANVVPPDLIREAIFSYTILAEREEDEDNKNTVRLIGELVSRAEFCQPP